MVQKIKSGAIDSTDATNTRTVLGIDTGGVNALTQASGINVAAGTGCVKVGPITIPSGQNITVAPGARLVLL